MDGKAMALLAAKALDEKKAADIVVIDIGGKAVFADYMVLASGSSVRQVSSLCEELEERFDKEGLRVRSIEGRRNSDWILMDYNDIVINLLTAEMREKYNIEKVWGDCEQLDPESYLEG